MLNSFKYQVVCFCNILFSLSIKRENKINMLLFLLTKKFIINHEKTEKQRT